MDFVPGAAFYFTDGNVDRRSLWTVIGMMAGEAGAVLILPFDLALDREGDVCVADSDDHSYFWARHFANYARVREAAVSSLQLALDNGQLVAVEALSARLLRKVLSGAAQTRLLKNRFRDLLEQQGLLD